MSLSGKWLRWIDESVSVVHEFKSFAVILSNASRGAALKREETSGKVDPL